MFISIKKTPQYNKGNAARSPGEATQKGERGRCSLVGNRRQINLAAVRDFADVLTQNPRLFGFHEIPPAAVDTARESFLAMKGRRP